MKALAQAAWLGVKAFASTRKGKALIISTCLGLAGIALPPEVTEALITIWSAAE